MTLASLSRATRRGLATFLFWWRLPPVSGPRKAIRDELDRARRAHGRSMAAIRKQRDALHAQMRREVRP